VLASLALVVVGDAQDDSRRSDTQSRISLLNSIIETRLENYETIRLPIDVKSHVEAPKIVHARELRRRIVMDIISSEMPRGFDDVALQDSSLDDTDAESVFPSQRFIDWANSVGWLTDPQLLVEELWGQVRTPTAFRFVDRGDTGAGEANEQLAAEIRTSSEYFYFILQDTQTAGTTGLEVLGDRFIGDTDGDGFLEIVDSWGNPIGFQFVMFDEEGSRVNNGTGNPMDLDPGLDDAAHPTIQSGVPTSNIRMFMFSTAGARPEDVSTAVADNGLQLITN